MERKLIRLAKNTLVVSIPKEFADRNRLKKGDAVDAVDKGHDLLITTGRDAPSRTCRLDVRKADDRLVRRMIAAAYKGGFETILVACLPPQEKMVEDVAGQLFGLILTAKSRGTVILKNTTRFSADDYEQILKKAALIVNDIADEILQAIESSRIRALQDVLKRKGSFIQHTHLALAILNAAGHCTIRETNTHFSIISLIDTIGDLFFHIATSYKEGAPYKDDIEFFRKIVAFFRNARLALFDRTPAEKLYEIRASLFPSDKKKDSSTQTLLKVIGKLTIELVECRIMLSLLDERTGE